MTNDGALVAHTGAVIVAHDQLHHAVVSLRSLRNSLNPQNVVLVLNMPDSVDPDALADLRANTRVISPPEPQGYGANLNLGVRLLPPDLISVVLANDDVVFQNGSVAGLVAPLFTDACVGAVGPMLRDEYGAEAGLARPFPTARDALLRSVVPSRLTTFLERVERRRRRLTEARWEDEPVPANTRATDWIVGAAMAVRLTAFREIGGFDEDFFYFEETDLCYRLWENGWKVVYAPHVAVVHLQGQSTGDDRYRRMLHRGRRRFLEKRLGRVRWAILELLLFGAFSITSLWVLVAGSVRPSTFSRRWRLVRSRWFSRLFLTRLS